MEIINLKNELEIKKLNDEIKQKQDQYLSKDYQITDFNLVRTTNFLSEDHVLKPLSKVAFVTNIGNEASYAISTIIKEKNLSNLKPADNSPISTQYRSTIHFTLNGLVSSHQMGNFDNQNFIIIDKLSNHLGRDNFKSLRMEDSFIEGEFKLSDDCVILIDKTKYDSLIKQYPYLSTYNIILFEGDEQLAVEKVLLDRGIIPEKIGEHGAKESRRTPLYEKALNELADKYQITRDKHCYSKNYQEDELKNLELWKIYNNKFYTQLFTYFNLNDDELWKNLTTSKDFLKNVNLLKNLILNLGIEEYCQFVKQYNQEIQYNISLGIYPDNDQILEDGNIILHNAPLLK